MKTIIALAFIVLASAELFHSTDDIDALSALSGNQTNVQQYFASIWNYYGLDNENASTCFSNAQANAYFAFTGYNFFYLVNLQLGNRVQAAYYATLMAAYNTTLSPALECVYNNPTFHMMIFQAGVTSFNISHFKMLNRVYFAAYFPDYAVDFQQVYTLLDQDMYEEAGYQYAPIIYSTVNNASGSMLNYNFMLGFENFLFFFYNLTSPTEFGSCYNEETATMELVFLQQWAFTVHNSTPATAANNTFAYMDKANKEFYPAFEPVLNCIARTYDQQRLVEAIGYDINSEEWWNAVFAYVGNSTSSYYAIFNQMFSAFDSVNPAEAGFLYASFIYAVNATIPNNMAS